MSVRYQIKGNKIYEHGRLIATCLSFREAEHIFEALKLIELEPMRKINELEKRAWAAERDRDIAASARDSAEKTVGWFQRRYGPGC